MKTWTNSEKAMYKGQLMVANADHASAVMRQYFKENEGMPRPPPALECSTGYALYVAEKKAEAGKASMCFDKKFNKKVKAEWGVLPKEQQEKFNETAEAAKEAWEEKQEKYEDALEEYLRDHWAPIGKAIEARDLDAFMKAMDEAVDSANAWHEKKDKGYIRWKMPSEPPPDLDLTPRE